MLASSAAQLGFRTIVLEPQPECPAAQLCNRQIVAAYDDEDALTELAQLADVVTYEFENVPLTSADIVARHVALYPPSRALQVAQDRLAEKKFLDDLGAAIAPHRPIATVDDLEHALSELGGGVLKTTRMGYDGKGQHVFTRDRAVSRAELQATLEQLGGITGQRNWVLEQLIDFEFEFSIVAARSIDGAVVSFDPARNTHENGILRRSHVPSRLSKDDEKMAAGHVETIMKALDYVGVIGVEFFKSDEGIVVNEIAPRVHNSGHWTVEACATSQFEQHIRAIAGLPLGSPHRHADCIMTNLLGHEADDITQALAQAQTKVTLYGKAEARDGRKMGHMVQVLP